MATIQLKRKLLGTAAAAPAAAVGEPLFSVPGFTGGGPNSLWISTGATAIPLVDNTRQVELAGNQSVAGVKTITGTLALPAVANMTVGDGTLGQSLVKGAGNALVWGQGGIPDAPADTFGYGRQDTAWQRVLLLAGGTMTGQLALAADAALPLEAVTLRQLQTTVAPLTLTFGDGLTLTGVDVDLDQATQAAMGGGMISTAALVAAGADDATLVSPLGLRSQLGADAATLVTTVKTVVPAINEIYTLVEQLVGVVIYAGSYDAATNLGTFNGQGGITAGTGVALPPASAANHGAYVIVTVAGTGTAPAPVEPMAIGDWVLSNGTTWEHLAFTQAASTADNIGLSPPVGGQNTVQGAIEAIYTELQTPGFYDATTFGGDAMSTLTQLTLVTVDGGTF